MRFLVYFKVYEMLKDVHIVVLPVQVVRYLGFLKEEVIKANFFILNAFMLISHGNIFFSKILDMFNE